MYYFLYITIILHIYILHKIMVTLDEVQEWYKNPLMKTDHSSWVKLDPRCPTPDGGYNWMYDYTLQKWIRYYSKNNSYIKPIFKKSFRNLNK